MANGTTNEMIDRRFAILWNTIEKQVVKYYVSNFDINNRSSFDYFVKRVSSIWKQSFRKIFLKCLRLHKDLVLNAEDDEYITAWQMEDVEKMTEAVCKRVKREIQKKKMIKNIEAMLEKRNGRKIKFSELDEKTKNAVLEAYAKTMEEYTNKSSD